MRIQEVVEIHSDIQCETFPETDRASGAECSKCNIETSQLCGNTIFVVFGNLIFLWLECF